MSKRKKLFTSLVSLFVVTCLSVPARAQAPQPLVAIHNSEFTRALETIPATGATPSGPGTTGNQWWPTNWHYFVMPDSVQEMLRSDGTAFTVVGDSDVAAGSLLNSNGLPSYPIVISLASEAIRDDEIAPFTNYVAAGGFLVVGSSSFTRFTNGTSRGDFAFPNELGLHMFNAGLTNWQSNGTFTAVSSHRLISHIPQGTLTWQMPSASEEISWPEAFHPPNPPTNLLHLIWQVRPAGATILAQGDSRPYLAIHPYGKGCFIYDAAMQPVIGHGGWAPGMYAAGILRNAIEWAFQNSKMPVPRLSAWPYQYNAAVVFRHDMEADPTLINSIENSAHYEFLRGAKGDYYFCTGELRLNMTNNAASIASLGRAVTNYGATIASHNGGLTNINTYIPPLTSNSYDYWHWGTDEALDLSPPGYSNGTHYALASLSNSFNDIQGWLPGTNNGGGIVHWVSPYFNSTREASYQIQEQLGVQITGDQKAGPYPHWTISTQTPDKLYSFLTLPVSDWFVGSQIGQAMENGHTTNTVHALVDYYYNLGALINLYNHSSSDGLVGAAGIVASEYVNYSLAKPAIWSANAVGIYNWWLARSNAQIAPAFSTNSSQSTATISVAGATDPNTGVEMPAPYTGYYNLQVLTNGVATDTNNYRTNGTVIKVLVGTTVTNAQVTYSLPPVAQDDLFVTPQDVTISNAAPGVLVNDSLGFGGSNLTASLVTSVGHGSLTLSNNGGFVYNPPANFVGVDSFIYKAGDGMTNSSNATATLLVTPPGYPFYDSMTRSGPSTSISPWIQQLGTSSVSNNTMASSSVPNSYGYAYYPNGTGWTDYVVQARIQFPASNGFGGGIGARLDPLTGAHYGAWIYPETSSAASNVLRLIKFEGWTTWSFTPMVQVSLPGVGTNFHTLTLAVAGTNISVYFDGVQKISAVDNNYDSVPAYTNGTICSEMFTFPNSYVRTMDDVVVAAANVPVIMVQPVDQTNDAGTTANFSVTALGTNLTYQWFKGGSLLSGATNSTLSLTNVLGGNEGGYSVVVTSPAGSVTSSTANLTVNDPLITSVPQSRTNNAGTTATFGVAATGSPTLSFRWFKNGLQLFNGGSISGATTTNLTITGVLGADAASYTVRVTNSFGNVTSAPPAVLTVIDPFITGQPQSRTNNAGTTASFTVTAAGTSTLNYRWFRNGVALNDGGAISGSATSNLNISGVLGANGGNYTVTVSNSFGVVTSAPPAVLTVIDPFITSQPQSRTNNAGTTATFGVSATGSATLAFRWFKNGSQLNNGGNISGATTTNLTITGVLGADAGNYTVRVTNNFGSVTSAPPAVLTVIDPLITAAPQSRTNNAGTTASFTVAATGTGTLNFRWFRNGVLLNNGGNFSGTTTTNLTLSSVFGADAGNYTVTVSNNFGTVTSTPPAVLTVIDPIISAPPISMTNNAGTTASFSVTAIGSATLNYSWFKNGSLLTNGGNVTGATTTNLILSNVFGADGANYTVVVSNNFGVATSAPPALLTVIDPVITLPPVSTTNNAGTTASFTVTAAGSATLNYSWFKDGSPLSDGGNITGSTTTNLTLSNVMGADGGNYVVIVSNSFGSATSAPPALFTVIDPIITLQPVSQTNAPGTSANFSVGAIGTSPLYQWLKNGVPIGGQTNTTFTIASVAPSDAANYAAIVSNNFNSVTSSVAVLTVASGPVIQSIVVNGGIATVTWSSFNGQTYRLQFNTNLTTTTWTDVSPDVTATNSTASATNAASDAQQFYRVFVVPQSP